MHPIQSPQNRFCVLTLDPETLPAIATTLIDVLFYSHRWALVGFGPHTLFPGSFPSPSAHPWVLQFCVLFHGWGSWLPVTPLCPALRSRQAPKPQLGPPSHPGVGRAT